MTRSIRLILALLGAYALGCIGWLLATDNTPAQSRIIADLAYLPLSLTMVAFAWRAATNPESAADHRRAWRWMTPGFISLAVGDVLWAYADGIVGERAFPSVADLGFLGLYPFLLAGLLVFASARSHAARTRFGLDALTILVFGAMVTWHFILRPVAVAGSTDEVGTLLSLAYPVGDLVLLGGLAQVLVLGSGLRATWSLRLLLAGVACFMAADFGFGVMSVQTTYVSGSWPDIAWLAARWLWLLSAAVRVAPVAEAERSRNPRETLGGGWASTVPPYLAVAAGYALLVVVAWDQLDDPLGGPLVGAIVLTGLVVVRQVAAQRENARLLREWTERKSMARFQSLVQHSSDITTVVDARSTIRYQSPSIEALTGFQSETLVGTAFTNLVYGEDAPQVLAFLAEAARQPYGRAPLEWRMFRQDGNWTYVETTATNLLGDPEVEGIVLNSRSVSDRKALEDQLRHQAFHDPLTNLANRALFRDRAEHALARANVDGEPVAVLYLDVDNFKLVNDSLGHPTGDALLAEIAIRLRGCARAVDTVARLGGDEFAILLEDLTGEYVPAAVAERVSNALRMVVHIGGQDVLMTASIGIADSASCGGVDELLRNADVAMYAAKANGKNHTEHFVGDMYARVRDRLDMTADLRRALEQGEFRVFYQPIVDLGSDRICEVEALVRWQHPERGLVAPDVFIPLAEETGLIVPLGRWVLETACNQARGWQGRQTDASLLVIGVNLSARQFADPDLLADVARILRNTGLPPHTLKLEITESAAMQDAASAESIMRGLKLLGVQLAIDDFGTGYSSLQYLKQFPVDTLKIDKSFVDGLGTDEQDTAIVQSVVALAKTLGLDVTGEGIESTIQHAQLRLLGVERGQGYLFARPQPAEAVDKLLFFQESTNDSGKAA